ncbi:MAG: hypothetical protein JWO36_2802 [Myxococcales bacterium]|nr:hypothetical protein [Myxococcales bacterium]
MIASGNEGSIQDPRPTAVAIDGLVHERRESRREVREDSVRLGL